MKALLVILSLTCLIFIGCISEHQRMRPMTRKEFSQGVEIRKQSRKIYELQVARALEQITEEQIIEILEKNTTLPHGGVEPYYFDKVAKQIIQEIEKKK